MGKTNRPGGAEVIPFRARTSQSQTTTQVVDAPSPQVLPGSLRDIVKALAVQRERVQREERLLAQVDKFHTLVIGAAALYGIDQVGFRVPNTDVSDAEKMIEDHFVALDRERGMSLVEGGFIKWGKDWYEDPNQDPRIRDFRRMVNMRAQPIPGKVDSLAEEYPILRKICPNIIQNPGLMARLMRIRRYIVNNMPKLNIQDFDINIRASDPPEYEREIYNFMRVFEKGWDVKVPSQIGVTRGEDSIDPKRERTMRPEEIDSIESRSYAMAVLRKLQGDTQARLLLMIRETDAQRVVPEDYAVDREAPREKEKARVLRPQETVMDYLKSKYNITIKSGNIVV